MASHDDVPLRQGAREGLDLFLMATEACGVGTPDLGLFLGVWIFIGEVGIEKKSGGPMGSPRGTGARPGGWAPPHPRGAHGTPLR